jgi:L-threonylcarbamoyladenylate synthase
MTKVWRVSAESCAASVASAVAVLEAGGIIAYPTDTLYGLGADPWQPEAVARVFAIKGRESNLALPLIGADDAQVEQALGRLPALARRLAISFWPGPLTLILAAPASLPPAVLGGGTTVAVRVPAHDVARALARALGRPLIATSANVSGQPATDEPGVVISRLGSRLDGVLDAGRTPGGPPSTIVDVTGESLRLVRPGAVPWERVVQSARA